MIRGCSFLSVLWEYTLSPQQREICQLLAQGLSQKKIAEALGISQEAVKVQIFRIKHKQMRIGVNKNEIKQPSQYPSTLFEAPMKIHEESELCGLIKELEASKGLNLTPLQKEIVLMRSRGRGVKTIAKSLGIPPGSVQANIHQAVAEIRRIQFSGNNASDNVSVRFIGGNITVNEIQVVSCLSNGMSVKGTANKLGKTESSVRAIMHRSGLSARVLKEQRKGGPGSRITITILLTLLRWLCYGNIVQACLPRRRRWRQK